MPPKDLVLVMLYYRDAQLARAKPKAKKPLRAKSEFPACWGIHQPLETSRNRKIPRSCAIYVSENPPKCSVLEGKSEKTKIVRLFEMNNRKCPPCGRTPSFISRAHSLEEKLRKDQDCLAGKWTTENTKTACMFWTLEETLLWVCEAQPKTR